MSVAAFITIIDELRALRRDFANFAADRRARSPVPTRERGEFDIDADICTFDFTEGKGIKIRYRGKWIQPDPAATTAILGLLRERSALLRALDARPAAPADPVQSRAA